MDAITTQAVSADNRARQRAETVPFKDRVTCTIPEACAASGLGRSSIYEAINDERLKTLKIGRRRLVIVASLLKWLEA
jgi:excisionase family DNA binding protein